MLERNNNCWRIERARRAAVIVDAADYFRLVRQAMIGARSQILLIGWDFDTRIDLAPEAEDEAPTELGAFVSWLPKQRPGLNIHILNWDVGAITLLGRGSTVFRLMQWAARSDIHFKLDGAHATGASHHQKIVVIDDKLAFCGGIDMTADRWDTREHKDDDERRRRPTTRRIYPPWHDATMAVDGAVAKALGELARERWKTAGGKPIAAPKSTGDRWPDELEPMFTNLDIAVSRSRGAHGELTAIREIEALFVDQIKHAQHYIYAENQYFASRTIAKAVAERLAAPNPPEIVIVNPRTGRTWLDDEAMSPARERLLRRIRAADKAKRFRIYYPVTKDGEDIYVHSKIFIADDRVLRVGSANMNNRSLGLDSECDLTIDASFAENAGCEESIARFLCDLLAEHLGTDGPRVAAHLADGGSLASAIEQLAPSGRRLVPLPAASLNSIETTLAESEMLDPEGSSEDFEPLARPGLMMGFSRIRLPRPSRQTTR
jgi:phosphatidylserine/phosphatidylglycerophosphate/cardiolipin synthase-like enzyme